MGHGEEKKKSLGTIIKRKFYLTFNSYSFVLVPLSALIFYLSVSNEEVAWSGFPEKMQVWGSFKGLGNPIKEKNYIEDLCWKPQCLTS